MPFSLEDYARLRPFAYHLTSLRNLSTIRRRRVLFSANKLLDEAGETTLRRSHRPISIELRIDSGLIDLRDQDPLKPWNLTLSSKWTMGDVVEMLNERVFFWPGWIDRPIDYGVRHFGRYADDPIAILRVPTSDLLAANAPRAPEFCKWNSGAPRWSMGRRPIRDLHTFMSATRANYRATDVKELTFLDSAKLPESTLVGPSAIGPWRQLDTAE
jgi:hypothetical protein